MDKDKKFKIEVWILGSLLGGPLVVAFAWKTFQWVFSVEDPSDIIQRLCIVCGVLFLIGLFLYFFITTLRRWDKTEKRDLAKNIQLELGLKPISDEEFQAKYIDGERFYVPVEPKPLNFLHRHVYHGEYRGYEICIFEPYRIPIRYWAEKGRFPPVLAVHLKSSSFDFPKFLITNTGGAKYFVKGDQNAQKQFAKPHILDFFNQTRHFAVQGNGNEFIFYEYGIYPTRYRLIIENAFNVLKLLTNAATPSGFSEIGLMQEKYKRTYKWDWLWTGLTVLFVLIIGLITVLVS